jgi:predicted transcriptional regulator
MTARQRVWRYIGRHPGKSACQISNALNLDRSSVSSLLKKLTDHHILERSDSGGPRGGHTYWRKAHFD